MTTVSDQDFYRDGGYQVDEHPRRFGARTDGHGAVVRQWWETVRRDRLALELEDAFEQDRLTVPLELTATVSSLYELIDQEDDEDRREALRKAARVALYQTRRFEQIHGVAYGHSDDCREVWNLAATAANHYLVGGVGTGKHQSLTPDDVDRVRAWWRQDGFIVV